MDLFGLFLIFGVVILLGIIGNAAEKQARGTMSSIHCPPHGWKWTEPSPGRIEVLKCQKCGFIAGPVDEHGRPNPNYNPPRGG